MERDALLKELRGLAEVRSLTPFVKERVEALHEVIMGHPFQRTSCGNCYHDAAILMYNYIKRGNDIMAKKEFILKRGVVIQNFGESKFYTAATLTDDVARKYLLEHPDKENLFEKVGALDEPAVVEVENEAPVEVAVETPAEATTPAPVKKDNKKRARR